MKRLVFFALCISAAVLNVQAQVCDPSTAPTGLSSTYTPGSGALLQWDSVPGSLGVQLRIEFSTGSSFNRRLLGTELDQFAVPDAVLLAGT